MTYSSTMTTHAEAYLQHRRQLGYELKKDGQRLLAFARWADRTGHRGPLTIAMALQWARMPQCGAPIYWASRLSVVRCFAQHRAIFDPKTQVPPKGLLGPTRQRRSPFIYSTVQIRQLLRAASALSPVGSLRRHTYTALFGFLASTGLRISEALRLRRDEVDLDAGLLHVSASKFDAGRRLPLHPSVTLALHQYVRIRHRHHPAPLFPQFFLSAQGRALTHGIVLNTFHQLRVRLGWAASPGGRMPRIHDLRHSFVCHTLEDWYRRGVDIDRSILSLSTYLGHRNVRDTYWYITGVPSLMALATKRFERSSGPDRGGQR